MLDFLTAAMVSAPCGSDCDAELPELDSNITQKKLAIQGLRVYGLGFHAPLTFSGNCFDPFRLHTLQDLHLMVATMVRPSAAFQEKCDVGSDEYCPKASRHHESRT